VHIVALHPEEKQFYYFRNGVFAKYEPITNASEIKTIHNMEEFIEGAKEWKRIILFMLRKKIYRFTC
jgi:hypothetical protein